MSYSTPLSIVTENYLQRFSCILEEMIKGMTGACLSNSISYNFMVQMIPHHMAAIEMSRNLLQYTTDIPLQNIALNIIAEQTRSIENMKGIMDNCRKCVNSDFELRLYQRSLNEIVQTMFAQMRDACSDNDVNANFMREMIPHHKGAIRMSGQTLQYLICPQLKPILNAIIISQEKGVARMERLLKEMCDAPCGR